MMRLFQCKTNLILVLIFAFVICIMARPYITNGLVIEGTLLINSEANIIEANNTGKSIIRPIKTIVVALFNESEHISGEEILEIIYTVSGEFAMFSRVWISLYLLTKMLSFYISFAYIKGWLIKVSQITCNKARLDFLHLKSGEKNEPSYKYLLTTCTVHSI